MIRFLLILALSIGLAFSQYEDDEEVFNFAGEALFTVKVKVDTPTVTPGKMVKGLCLVDQEPNQARYSFTIFRRSGGVEQELDNKAYFSFPVDSAEDVQGLYCRADDGSGSEEVPFTVNFEQYGNNLRVRTIPRAPDSVLLICELTPRPSNPARYRFKWLAPNGRVIANGPIALIKKAIYEANSADGFVCESLDVVTNEKSMMGLQENQFIRAVQSEGYSARVVMTPPKNQLRNGIRLVINASVVPTPPTRINYLWKYNGVVQPQFSGPSYIIPSLQRENAGEYSCEMSFLGASGAMLRVYAIERLMSSGPVRPAPSQSQTFQMEIDPKQKIIVSGTPMTFHCNIGGAGANPRSINWRFHPSSAGTSGYFEMRSTQALPSSWTVQFTDSSSYISKSAVTAADDGFYACVIGTQFEYGTLTVESPADNDGGFWSVEDDTTAVQSCLPNQRQCATGPDCYPIYKHCDGQRDCSDGSDETGCSCDPAIRKCGVSRDGRRPRKDTYNVNWECDGEDDCGNGYDESDCTSSRLNQCFPNMTYTCQRSPQKIPIAYLCDGTNDCNNGGDDESRCGTTLTFTQIYGASRDVTEGETVTFNCSISSYPPPRIVWRFNWRCLQGQSEGSSQVPYFGSPPIPRYAVSYSAESCDRAPRVSSTLTISNVQRSDAGIYNCEALVGAKRSMSDDMTLTVRTRF